MYIFTIESTCKTRRGINIIILNVHLLFSNIGRYSTQRALSQLTNMRKYLKVKFLIYNYLKQKYFLSLFVSYPALNFTNSFS